MMASNPGQSSSTGTHQTTLGFPFDEWSQSVEDTEQLVTPGDNRRENGFQPISTPFTISIIILIMFSYEVAIFLVPHYCKDITQCDVHPYSILMYAHGSLWFFLMLMDRYWQFIHYKSRTHGYLEFYRYTRHLRRMPFLIFSGGTAILLILTTLLSDECQTNEPSSQCQGVSLTRCQFAQIIITAEVAIITPILAVYLLRTIRFNRGQSVPDIQQEESFGSVTVSRSLCNGIGFRDDSYVDDILEKQADMIRYLKHHNTHLGRKILQLTAQLEHESS